LTATQKDELSFNFN